jgi:hypothetical protein
MDDIYTTYKNLNELEKIAYFKGLDSSQRQELFNSIIEEIKKYKDEQDIQKILDDNNYILRYNKEYYYYNLVFYSLIGNYVCNNNYNLTKFLLDYTNKYNFSLDRKNNFPCENSSKIISEMNKKAFDNEDFNFIKNIYHYYWETFIYLPGEIDALRYYVTTKNTKIIDFLLSFFDLSYYCKNKLFNGEGDLEDEDLYILFDALNTSDIEIAKKIFQKFFSDYVYFKNTEKFNNASTKIVEYKDYKGDLIFTGTIEDFAKEKNLYDNLLIKYLNIYKFYQVSTSDGSYQDILNKLSKFTKNDIDETAIFLLLSNLRKNEIDFAINIINLFKNNGFDIEKIISFGNFELLNKYFYEKENTSKIIPVLLNSLKNQELCQLINQLYYRILLENSIVNKNQDISEILNRFNFDGFFYDKTFIRKKGLNIDWNCFSNFFNYYKSEKIMYSIIDFYLSSLILEDGNYNYLRYLLKILSNKINLKKVLNYNNRLGGNNRTVMKTTRDNLSKLDDQDLYKLFSILKCYGLNFDTVENYIRYNGELYQIKNFDIEELYKNVMDSYNEEFLNKSMESYELVNEKTRTYRIKSSRNDNLVFYNITDIPKNLTIISYTYPIITNIDTSEFLLKLEP